MQLQIAPHNMEFVGLRKSYVKALEKLALVSNFLVTDIMIWFIVT